ncbi:MAG: histidinol-phosphatase, partial [Treponema sp.]|nr:histidinol-phosphatase [Treponema sp.]
MRYSCIHTHTIFCDGADDVETCCRAAFEKGLVSLGFSSHAPIQKKTGIKTTWHLGDDRLEEYLESVRAAQKRWAGKLPVYLGLEVDFIPGLIGPADKDYREMGLDFIIGAVHYVVPSRGEPFIVDDQADDLRRNIKAIYGGDSLAMVEAYWDCQEAMIRAGGFDVLAHPDLVKKNNTMPGGSKNWLFCENGRQHRQRTAAIAALMGQAGIPAEINTGGLNRGKTNDCFPSLDFLKQFREHDVPIVINADAHRWEHLGGHYEEARKSLIAAGYSQAAIFAGRRDGRA